MVNSSPAIAADGTIYVGSSDYDLYEINSSIGGLVDSKVSILHHVPKHNFNLKKLSNAISATPFSLLNSQKTSS